MHRGSCLCGAVRFEVAGDLTPPTACHCTKCRKHTGHYEAGTDVLKADLVVFGEEKVGWYQSSEKVRRGFCTVCGSSLFFDPIHHKRIGIYMGAFDTPDGLPQNQQ